MRLELMTDRLRVRPATHCTMPLIVAFKHVVSEDRIITYLRMVVGQVDSTISFTCL